MSRPGIHLTDATVEVLGGPSDGLRVPANVFTRRPVELEGGVVGFTGTQHGMSDAQRDGCQHALIVAWRHGARRFAHGCCIGADEQAAEIAYSIGYWLHGFPAHELGHPKRAETPDSITEPVPTGPTPELTRNRAIVAVTTELLLAAPRQDEEVRRSGTWATVRYAWAANLKTTILTR